MEPWYRIATPRKEVREGRSFSPDEFAIALEQVVAGTAPKDYREPDKFFARTYFTRALREHSAMVLRRLAGKTENTAPVLMLITQFGGGKTHTLTTLYHLARSGKTASNFAGVSDLLNEAGLSAAPKAEVAVFVGNAWDPQEGRETPWIDVARQLAGDAGVEILGPAAKTSPPGTEAIGRLFEKAGGTVLILFDEVLNFFNRHRNMADSFHAFIQNLTVAMTGTTRGALVVSLPRSQVEMTDWDIQWQDKITKVVRRVAKDLIANDEAEISEVIRRRLFEDLGSEKVRKNVAKSFADWCFERRAQLPSEWTAVDSSSQEIKAREYLRGRFEACYPYHPSALSVFQRKWAALPQYQQTRGTLTMLAQWISAAYKEGYKHARREALITLGSAPLDVPEFRAVILGQLGEPRLIPAIEADISGPLAHAKALDADAPSQLREIHKRVGSTILFESSGGQRDKIAHLPELRFALGEPDTDTTSVDSAALALEAKAYFIRRIGSDGFQIRHQPTLRKVVNDRRASLDEKTEVLPTMRTLIRKEFERGASIPVVTFPEDSAAIQDSPRLTLVVADPEMEWIANGNLRKQIFEWTTLRGSSPRLYPGSLVWCLRKPGRDLREKIELWLAWKRVAKEIADGTLGVDFDRTERSEIQTKLSDAEESAKDEVWAGYRFVLLAENSDLGGIRVIDLGAGHSSSTETLCGRVVSALKSQALLNESVGAGYIDRNWPPALMESGAWPLTSLRQSFLNGALTRMLDPDGVLRNKIVEFVSKGEFGLASGQKNGAFDRVWFRELIAPDEVVFEPGVFLLRKSKAEDLKVKAREDTSRPPIVVPERGDEEEKSKGGQVEPGEAEGSGSQTRTLRLVGTIPPELWNRLGTKLIPKLRSGTGLTARVEFSVAFDSSQSHSIESELRQILDDLGLNTVRIERQ
jgi:hypothetical protein